MRYIQNSATSVARAYYKKILRPILFRFDSEVVHTRMTTFGEFLGYFTIFSKSLKSAFVFRSDILSQIIHNIEFKTPIGLAAGFDYEARLTQVTYAIGFGFQTVGTITNKPYGGNPPPLLGRLPRSKSLLVNKGFKNEGIDAIEAKCCKLSFPIPIGLSIGKTNSREPMTQDEAIIDVVSAFKKAEKGEAKWSYYELNISCPNLFGNVEFYSEKNLRELLSAVTRLELSRPMFIKMPIDKNDEEVLKMLSVISIFPVAGVIFGNLQKNRQDPTIISEEAAKYERGYFSGKPTEKRSNELIRLAYKNFGNKLTIIGCGGVFSADDAYAKIRLGASLVQLITGLIYEGPQLPAEINLGLEKLLVRDGFKHISEAIGVDNK